MDRLSRDAKWNLSLAVLVLSSALTARLAGTAWLTIGAVLGGAVLLAVVLSALVYLAVRRRDPWRRFLREQAKAETVETRRALPIRAAGEHAA